MSVARPLRWLLESRIRLGLSPEPRNKTQRYPSHDPSATKTVASGQTTKGKGGKSEREEKKKGAPRKVADRVWGRAVAPSACRPPRFFGFGFRHFDSPA